MSISIGKLAKELGVTKAALHVSLRKARKVWPACFKVVHQGKGPHRQSYLADADAQEIRDIYKFRRA